jgi:peptidyl-prolyl cis-trans isomerase-like 4
MQDVLIDDRRIHVDFSQSVSKLSNVWRNDTNSKRKANASRGGGWGGIRELEKRRQYRHEVDKTDDGYRMVYGEEEMKGRHARNGDRLPPQDEPDAPPRDRAPPAPSRSGPPRAGEHGRSDRHRSRSRSPRRRDYDRHYSSRDHGNGGRRDQREYESSRRDRDRDRDRHRDRDRDRSRRDDGYRHQR